VTRGLIERRSENIRVWYLIIIGVVLGTVAMGSLVITYRSSENARLAEVRANAAEFRSAKNTILNCSQYEQIQEVMKKLDVPPAVEPLCDPYEVEQLRKYVKLFEWIESRKPELLEKVIK
jgi:S-methylmethionine-dependent homocysteine/selenocysteine methylase